MSDETKNSDKYAGCRGCLVYAIIAIMIILYFIIMNLGPNIVYDDFDKPGLRRGNKIR